MSFGHDYPFVVPCVLVVDTSKSMEGAPIDELNRGLVEFGNAFHQDAKSHADVCIISFSTSVNIEVSFRPASEYKAPTLTASGLSSMNEAINTALDALEDRKALYRDYGLRYLRPWIFLMTDGDPTDSYLESSTMTRLRSAIRNKKVVYLPMGIGPNADLAKLRSYYPDGAASAPVLTAGASHFKEAFGQLSADLSKAILDWEYFKD